LWQSYESRTKVFAEGSGGPSHTTSNPGFEASTTRTELGFSFAFADHWTLDLGLSYVDIRLENSTNPQDVTTERVSGFGDTALIVRRVIVDVEPAPEDESTSSSGGNKVAEAPRSGTRMAFGLGVSLPTGEPERPIAAGPVANSTLQTGTGTFDPLLTASLMHDFSSWSAFSHAILRIPGGENRYDYRTGAALQVSVGGSRALGDRWSISPRITYLWRASDRIDGEAAFASGGEWLSVVPALELELFERSHLEILAEIPLWRDLRTDQLDSTMRFAAGFTTRW